MADFRVTCVTRLNRGESHGIAHDGLSHLGGHDWRWHAAEVMRALESKSNTFHTEFDGKRHEIAVLHPDRGTKFLQTMVDGVWTLRLMELPECAG